MGTGLQQLPRLGVVRSRDGRLLLTRPTLDYPAFMELLCRWVRQMLLNDVHTLNMIYDMSELREEEEWILIDTGDGPELGIGHPQRWTRRWRRTGSRGSRKTARQR